MVERIDVAFAGGAGSSRGAYVRYDVLMRLRRVADAREVAILAFGWHDEGLRLVLEGTSSAISHTLRALKIGTRKFGQQWSLDLQLSEASRDAVDDLADAVAWAHRAPVDCGAISPLASPWSSHRDLMGYRVAGFYDASVLARRVDRLDVHFRAGGTGVPDGWPPTHAAREPLEVLLRVAGAVVGVLPSDRRCFRLFVHLARARGWSNRPTAHALAMTDRRVRQLAAEPEENVLIGLITLSDPRLCLVP
jgi:hypothetical protein